jgi:hypothetical protein
VNSTTFWAFSEAAIALGGCATRIVHCELRDTVLDSNQTGTITIATATKQPLVLHNNTFSNLTSHTLLDLRLGSMSQLSIWSNKVRIFIISLLRAD